MNRANNARAKRIAKAFARARGGVAAVEFGMIAPILAILLIGVIDVGMIAYERVDMSQAIRAGAQYFMAGGSDFDRAAQVVRGSWSEAPKDATVKVDRFCLCQKLESACSQPCPDGTVPAAYARITASAKVEGIFREYGTYTTDVIRVR
jgi:Flp pilus assembly pilin Flp